MGPAQLAVLIARLTGIAHEMGEVLRRGAFSPNIKERADCSAALFTADGLLLVQAEHIPVHLGSMPASVTAAIAALGDDVRPGEQVILNDPFADLGQLELDQGHGMDLWGCGVSGGASLTGSARARFGSSTRQKVTTRKIASVMAATSRPTRRITRASFGR